MRTNFRGSFDVLTKTAVDELRATHYNARVTYVNDVHEELRILRVVPDWGRLHYLPGQHTNLGLGSWEPSVDETRDTAGEDIATAQLIKRPYSISCPLIDETGRLLPPDRCEFLEFYITLVPRSPDRPPGLTPRLFRLHRGDRLYVAPHASGHYTLAPVDPDDIVIFAATGTGEAPHNAMVAHLLDRGHRGPVVSVTCVRFRRDLAYLWQHRELERQFANYRYLTLTTREPENLDRQHPAYVGKQYLQDYFESGQFFRDANLPVNPQRTHVYLCGSPQMIGAPRAGSSGADRYPKPKGMVEVLESLGFHAGDHQDGGNIHFERYW
jgi:ferredoxin--NADP+ reductase